MPPKPRFLCMDKDDAIWEEMEERVEKWVASTRSAEKYRAVVKFILKHKEGDAEVMHPAVRGGYNVIYRLEYKDGSSVIMRVPIPDVVPFPEEKIKYEVATMRFVAANTTIPVPHVYHWGSAAENPTGLGPFIIMKYIDHHQNMSRELLDPTQPLDERPILNPDIEESKLEYLYSQMANVMLQLSCLEFPKVGSLAEDDQAVPATIKGRPLTSNLNDIVVHNNLPKNILPLGTCASSNEWYQTLANLHATQLALQYNDAVEDEDDARDKCVARQLFRKLAAEERLVPNPSASDEGFQLFSEDFRPANVLLDKDLRIVGVIDWEFAYAAPAQFSYGPPWWLLLEEPESWKGGYKAWMEIYEPRLKTFLRVLEAEEQKMAPELEERFKVLDLTNGRKCNMPLSKRMRKSWDKKTWMISYAARKSWAFDFIWWKFLDEMFFGPNEDQDHKARLGLLTDAQREAMEAFVGHKMRDMEDRRIVCWTEEEAKARLDLLIS